jgi:NADH dehydrogenase [ubiquinone] 1 alpha subcomplex assembly factor 7
LTALAGLLRDLIREQGPLDIGRYMTLALAHPEHGYYTSRDPLGAGGDFITAPEISQLFGELVGLALVQFWLDNGRPRPVLLVELGPGRGTLAADALRAARVAPRFLEAAELHLVEASPILRARQAEVLGRHGPRWHATLGTIPATVPLLVIANEFFDVLPLRQFVHHRGSWHERLVGVNEAGAFQLRLAPRPSPVTVPGDAAEGAVLELAPAREAQAQELAQRLARQGGMALIIDYGEQQPCLADTFQAVRSHKSVDPLAAPGETDLTAHVDFGAIAAAAAKGGAAPYGPVPQGLFLRRLGIELRLEQLLARAEPSRAEPLQAGVRRLTAPDAMGELFKVLALTAPGASVPPGFEPGEAGL